MPHAAGQPRWCCGLYIVLMRSYCSQLRPYSLRGRGASDDLVVLGRIEAYMIGVAVVLWLITSISMRFEPVQPCVAKEAAAASGGRQAAADELRGTWWRVGARFAAAHVEGCGKLSTRRRANTHPTPLLTPITLQCDASTRMGSFWSNLDDRVTSRSNSHRP